MTQRKPAALAVLALLVLSVPAAAVLRSPPSRGGRPGHPVAIGDGGLTLRGPVGTLVHIHLAQPLAVPDVYDRDERYTVTGSGDWAGLVLGDETRDGNNNLALVTTSKRLACQGPCPETYNTTTSNGFGTSLPAGDYVLTLAGPRGTTVRATLKGNDPTLPPTAVTGGYAMPYVSGRAADATGSTPHRGGYGGVAAPAVSRRTLGVVLLTVRERGRGTNVDIKLCVGGYLPPSTTDRVGDLAQRHCLGGGYEVDSGPAYPLTGAAALHPAGFAYLQAQGGTGTFEINSGGGWSATCDDAQCTFDGQAYAVAVDS